MTPEKRNPAARAGANRVLDIDVLGRAFDTQDPKALTPIFQSETLAMRSLMQRFGLTIHHARVVCELYGLGGAA